MEVLNLQINCEENNLKKLSKSQVLVAHACNSYSGGRDQEDGGSKPTQANSS
jgi:hypothetical protein